MLITPLFFGCSKAPAPSEESIRPVRVIRLADPGDLPVLTLPGEVRPRVESRLGFRVAGKIARRLVQAGDVVRSGQLLAQLDPQDLAPAIESASANLESAVADLRLAGAERDRVQALRAKDFVSQAQVDRAQAQLDSAQGRVRAAQAALVSARNSAQFQSLNADVDGVVIAVEAEPGQVVMAGQSVIRIARGRDRDVVVSVPETSLRLAQSAKNLVITSPTLAGERLVGRIRESSPVADSASRTYALKIEPSPAKPAERLPLGASATVSFELPATPGVLVPLSALHSSTANPKIWVVDETNLTVRSVAVQIAEDGLRDNGVKLQVSDATGLRLGQLVVTAGANLLREGQKVRLPTASVSPSGSTGSTSPMNSQGSSSPMSRP
jgi:RND family efflux transporter MFP subunit